MANENGTDSLDSFLLKRKLMKEEHLEGEEVDAWNLSGLQCFNSGVP